MTAQALAAACRREYVSATVSHVLWGLERARDDDGIPEIRLGTVAELSALTGIPSERLRRRLVRPGESLPGSYAHRTGGVGRVGPVAMSAWEYLYICECLAISTNPFVRSDRDGTYGYVSSRMG